MRYTARICAEWQEIRKMESRNCYERQIPVTNGLLVPVQNQVEGLNFLPRNGNLGLGAGKSQSVSQGVALFRPDLLHIDNECPVCPAEKWNDRQLLFNIPDGITDDFSLFTPCVREMKYDIISVRFGIHQLMRKETELFLLELRTDPYFIFLVFRYMSGFFFAVEFLCYFLNNQMPVVDQGEKSEGNDPYQECVKTGIEKGFQVPPVDGFFHEEPHEIDDDPHPEQGQDHGKDLFQEGPFPVA